METRLSRIKHEIPVFKISTISASVRMRTEAKRLRNSGNGKYALQEV